MTAQKRMQFGRYDYASFLTFFAYASGSVVVPVALVLIARELGFDLEAGGMGAGGALHLGRTVPIVISMLLCGFASGRWGTRRSVGVAVLVMGIGMGLCAFADSYVLLLSALVIAGFGEGIVEGLATPFVRDIHPDESGRYINFSHAFWSVGVLVTVLLSGALLSAGVPWRAVLLAVSLLSLLPAWLILAPPRRGPRYPDRREPVHWRQVMAHAADILRRPRFWLFFLAMFVAGGGEFCLTFWSASYVQLAFTPAVWAGGVATACFAAGMVLGRTGWGVVIRQDQLRRLLIGSAAAGVVITAMLPAAKGLIGFYLLLFAAGVTTAPFWPTLQSYCADRLPGTDTTMVFVLLSCAGIPGCGFFTWLTGHLGDRCRGLGPALYLVPACFMTIAILVIVDAGTGGRHRRHHRGSVG